MPDPFSKLVARLLHIGNFDHADLDTVDSLGKKHGLSQTESRQAFFVARDKATLIESEQLEGGTGNRARKTRNKKILESTFSRGETKE